MDKRKIHQMLNANMQTKSITQITGQKTSLTQANKIPKKTDKIMSKMDQTNRICLNYKESTRHLNPKRKHFVRPYM